MTDFTLKLEESPVESPLQHIARKGAQQLLQVALENEINNFITQHKDKVGIEGGPRQIVRNGFLPEREIKTGIGPLNVRVPRSRDLRKDVAKADRLVFESHLVPRYLRKSHELNDFIPYLYLKGISTSDFSDVLGKLVGHKFSCSPSTVVQLKKEWESEYHQWGKADLSNKEYIYWWVDGIYFNVRLADEKKSCVLVIIGATAEGRKELVAIDTGYRESELTWKNILLNLKSRGLENGPRLVIGDGALGFWKAVKQVYPESRHQRCWVHRMANVLDKMPKSIQKQAKSNIHEIYLAPNRKKANEAFGRFVKLYEAKYPGAVECLLKTKEETMTFYDFPAEHWRHIRSTNPIESTFATVRLRTYKTKGCGSTTATLTMVFKLVQAAQKRWHRLRGYNLIPLVFEGIVFEDGLRKAA